MKSLLSAFVLATALIAAPACAAPPAAKLASSAAHHQADELRQGKRMTVLVTGNPQGPDVVLIPGLASPRSVWDPTVAALKDRYRLHVVQVRGFGDAPGDNLKTPILTPLTREIADYIDDEIINKKRPAPAIIGHSMGGLSALMIGRDHPQVASKLLVVDTLPYFGVLFGNIPNKDRFAQELRDNALADAKAGKAPPATGDKDPGGIWSITPDGRKQVARWTASADQTVTANLMYEVMTTNMIEDLARISTPITLLYPTSPAVSPERAEALYGGSYFNAKGAKLIAVPDSYHFIMIDQPARFQAEVEKFLKG